MISKVDKLADRYHRKGSKDQLLVFIMNGMRDEESIKESFQKSLKGREEDIIHSKKLELTNQFHVLRTESLYVKTNVYNRNRMGYFSKSSNNFKGLSLRGRT